jgi:peptide/nickel transport system substrate-binding protein
MYLGRRKRRLGTVAAIAAAGLIAAGCGGSSGGGGGTSSSGGTKVKGGTATVAIIAGTQANYIFPFMSLTYFSVYNSQYFQNMMYRPLYVFGGNSQSVDVNYPLSPAAAPIYSNGGKTIVINMKGWKWSNGETVDANSVLFWLHMMVAEEKNWAAFSPGGIPENITSMKATGPNQVTLTLDKAYSSLWYTYNELSQITPMPQTWDVTKAGAKPGSGGCTTDTAANKYAKCVKVYNFLADQAKKTSTYASSPIWQISDGPWKLQTFNTDGSDVFVPNKAYSGSPKATIAAVKFVPYTTDTAEFTGVKAGQVDSGFIPSQDLPQKPVSQVLPTNSPAPANYNLQPFYNFGVNYFQVNWNNTTLGPAFKQLYIRQALEYLVDQVGMSKSIYRGYGYPTTGAVPAKPPNKWIPASQAGAGPYPFSVSKATSLLTSHGWSKVNGVMTCQDPSKCGAGVKKGTQLKISFDYSSGSQVFTQEAEIYKSDAAKAGVVLNTASKSFNTVISEAVPTNHSWQIAMYGGWVYAPDYEPTGEALFQTGAGSNGGAYSDPKMDQLIKATTTSGDINVFHQFADYAAQQLPFVWMPNLYNIQTVDKKLHNVTFNPLFTFTPEYWYFTK